MAENPGSRPARAASCARRLTLSLAGDLAFAEDLVQDTWLRALAPAAQRPRDARAWLGTIMRNLWRQRLRSEGRRERRENEVPQAEQMASATDVVQRADGHRMLVAALTELDEPFKSTLLLRYYDDLSPALIAQQLGVPLNTVRSRLRRGLTRLRARLDARHGGDRESWLSALLPLIGRTTPESVALPAC